MKKKILISSTLSAGLFLIGNAQAALPTWTIVPLTSTQLSLSAEQTATVQYQVTNQSKRVHILSMKPITGISQVTTPGNCSASFRLGYQQSCILTLTVRGASLSRDIIGGPVICEQNSSLQCYQPSQQNSLAIRRAQQPPVTTANINVNPSALSFIVGGTSQIVTLSNTSSLAAQNLTVTIPPSSAISIDPNNSTCTSTLAGNTSCQYGFLPGNQSETNTIVSIAGSNTQSPVTITMTVTPPPQTTLSSSIVPPAQLALQTAGAARTITITNIGSAVATNVTYSPSPALPGGTPPTTISPASCGNIQPNSTCILTVTPGSIPSAPPGDLNPTAITLTIRGANTNELVPQINIIGLGSVYQQGFIFEINDATPGSGSIGGKVVGLEDIPPDNTWTSPGFSVTSAQSFTNGFDNTALIVANSSCLNNTAGCAAYQCSNLALGGYTNWYLPAICEMGPDSSGSGCQAGLANIVDSLPGLRNSCVGTQCLAGRYWSSTEDSAAPVPGENAWYQLFGPLNTSSQGLGLKNNDTIGTRCVRTIS